jgi:hypothetical protein
MARSLVRYILFADEVPLPASGVVGDSEFKKDFAASAQLTASGASLRDLDLRTRLMRHRCSYMIYSPAFAGLPPLLKAQVFHHLQAALGENGPSSDEFAYLPAEEKSAILGILRETLPDFPKSLHADRS